MKTLRRFIELRFDGTRTIEGTVVRYGDTAKLSWGGTERIERGAFGNVEGADVILNMQHDRGKPLARTGGGGLELIDNPTSLSLRAVLPQTRDADDALELVRSNILRGFSIEFTPKEYRLEGKKGEMAIVEKAELGGVGLVDKPAYPQSSLREEIMGENNKLEDAIKAVLAEGKPETYDPDQVASSVAQAVAPVVEQQITAAFKERDDAIEARQKAEAETIQTRETMETEVQERSDLLTSVKEILPKTFESKGASIHDILVAAAGDEVKEAKERSEDYLRAKVESILERREEADKGLRRDKVSVPGATGGVPMDPYSLHNLKSAKEATR